MNLDELNPAQRAAVLYTDGPSLVIAGAGSGKTRVLTYKVAYLLSQGMKPWNILALTFTNKAAEEMKSRITRQMGEDATRGLWMGTFHSIFARILRAEHEAIGFSSNFTIYDATDSKSLIRSIIREMGLDDKQYKAGTVASHISAAKNRLLLPSQYQRDAQIMQADNASRIPATSAIGLAADRPMHWTSTTCCFTLISSSLISRKYWLATRRNSSLCSSMSIRTLTTPSMPSCGN